VGEGPSTRVGPSAPIVKPLDDLAWEDIEDVFAGRRIALRVPQFYPEQLCEQFAERIAAHSSSENYPAFHNVKRIGKAIGEAASDPAKMQEYYSLVHAAHREVRELFQPYLAPMDKFRLVLQEVWPAGSQIERLNGLPMFCGLTRTYGEGAEILPHQDMTHWHLPAAAAAKSLITQGAANVHLSAADDGGELEVWSLTLRDRDEYERFQTEGHYGLDRERLGPPAFSVKPQPDLSVNRCAATDAVKPRVCQTSGVDRLTEIPEDYSAVSYMSS
jgi:hypothetical protein